jgi:hypothetical protein
VRGAVVVGREAREVEQVRRHQRLGVEQLEDGLDPFRRTSGVVDKLDHDAHSPAPAQGGHDPHPRNDMRLQRLGNGIGESVRKRERKGNPDEHRYR